MQQENEEKRKKCKKGNNDNNSENICSFRKFFEKKKIGQKILKISFGLLANLTLNLKYISGLNNKRCMWQDLLFSYLFFVKFWLFFSKQMDVKRWFFVKDFFEFICAALKLTIIFYYKRKKERKKCMFCNNVLLSTTLGCIFFFEALRPL